MKKLKLLLIPSGFLFFLMLIYSLGTYNNQVYFILKHLLMFAFLGSLILVSQFILHDFLISKKLITRKNIVTVKLSIGVLGVVLLFLVGNMQFTLIEEETPFLVGCDFYTMDKRLVYKSYGDTCATYQKYGEDEYVFHEEVKQGDVRTNYMTHVKMYTDDSNRHVIDSYVYVTEVSNDQMTNDLHRLVQTTYEEFNRLYIKNEYYVDEGVGVISALGVHIYDTAPIVTTWMVTHEEQGSNSISIYEFGNNDETTKQFIARRYKNENEFQFTGMTNIYNFQVYSDGEATGQTFRFDIYDYYPSNGVITLEEKGIINEVEYKGFVRYNDSMMLSTIKEIDKNVTSNSVTPYEIYKEDATLYVGATFFYQIDKVADGDLFQLEMFFNTNGTISEVPEYMYNKTLFDEFDYQYDLFNYTQRPRRFYHAYNPLFERIYEEGTHNE